MNRPPRYMSKPVRSRRNRRRPNWLKIIVNVLLLAVTAEVVFMALTSPRLQIRRVDVRGNRTIPVGVLRASASPVIGSNIFLANTRRVRKSLLKNPIVRDAKVRKWPANRIIIHVEERVPTAVVLHNTRAYLTDEDGFIYDITDEPKDDLPIVEIPAGANLNVGSKKRLRSVRLALICIKQADGNDLSVEKISVDPRNNICLNMSSGLQVRLGPAIDLEKKLSILHGVLAAKPDFASDAVYLDLSCTSAPAWKSRDTSSFPPTP